MFLCEIRLVEFVYDTWPACNDADFSDSSCSLAAVVKHTFPLEIFVINHSMLVQIDSLVSEKDSVRFERTNIFSINSGFSIDFRPDLFTSAHLTLSICMKTPLTWEWFNFIIISLHFSTTSHKNKVLFWLFAPAFVGDDVLRFVSLLFVSLAFWLWHNVSWHTMLRQAAPLFRDICFSRLTESNCVVFE